MDRTAGRLHAERIYRSQGPPPDSEAGQWRENRTGRSPDMTRWKSPARLRRVGMKRKARIMGEWQPISTVPFGVPVLIWVPGINRGRDSAEVVVVLQPLGGPLVRTSNRGVVYRSNGGPDDGDAHMLDWDFAPTHWMALPPPPKQ